MIKKILHNLFSDKDVNVTPNIRWAYIPDTVIWHLMYYHTYLPKMKLTFDRNGLPVPEPMRERKVSWWA